MTEQEKGKLNTYTFPVSLPGTGADHSIWPRSALLLSNNVAYNSGTGAANIACPRVTHRGENPSRTKKRIGPSRSQKSAKKPCGRFSAAVRGKRWKRCKPKRRADSEPAVGSCIFIYGALGIWLRNNPGYALFQGTPGEVLNNGKKHLTRPFKNAIIGSDNHKAGRAGVATTHPALTHAH